MTPQELDPTTGEYWMRLALGMNPGESVADWLRRKQDECNRLREAAVLEEREACAKLCDDRAGDVSNETWNGDVMYAAGLLATAIRARSQEAPAKEIT